MNSISWLVRINWSCPIPTTPNFLFFFITDNCYANIKIIYYFILDLCLTIESCNLIGQQHLATPEPDHTQSKWYYKMFPWINLSKHTKNEGNFSTRSWDTANLKILQSDWLRAFLPISQELELFQVWNFHREVHNDERFHFRSTPGKTNDKIYKNPWKTLFLGYFGPILRIFWPLNFDIHDIHNTTIYISTNPSFFNISYNA